jgi:hypothetical protein
VACERSFALQEAVVEHAGHTAAATHLSEQHIAALTKAIPGSGVTATATWVSGSPDDLRAAARAASPLRHRLLSRDFAWGWYVCLPEPFFGGSPATATGGSRQRATGLRLWEAHRLPHVAKHAA